MGRTLRTGITLAVFLMLLATPAYSHPGHGAYRSFLHYFLDHGMGIGLVVVVGAAACWRRFWRAREITGTRSGIFRDNM